MMYPPPSSCKDMPLFSTTFMQENLIIQQPACESMSFNWSDFPIVHQQDVRFEHFASYPSFEEEKPSLHPHVPSSGRDLYLVSKSSSTSSPSSKRETFSRKHSIALGDHPCCKSLPIDLGSDSDETQRTDLSCWLFNSMGF